MRLPPGLLPLLLPAVPLPTLPQAPPPDSVSNWHATPLCSWVSCFESSPRKTSSFHDWMRPRCSCLSNCLKIEFYWLHHVSWSCLEILACPNFHEALSCGTFRACWLLKGVKVNYFPWPIPMNFGYQVSEMRSELCPYHQGFATAVSFYCQDPNFSGQLEASVRCSLTSTV